jgi:type I restriction enzyme S subunit
METALKNIPSVRYSSYKDSGIEWVEDVPAHWEVKKFKRVFYEIKKRSNPDLNCGSISFGRVVYKDDEKIPESTKKSYQVVKKGDFLVNPLNLNYDLISLRIALSDIDVVVSSGYIVLSNSIKLDKTFYKYFLHRFDVAFMKLLGSGVRQTLNWNDIANCDLIFPPLPEQTAIAAFLDRKTALIDQAIGIKQKQIELLKERRQILIHKAVTRGLNPDVKMKDSGVEWIGEIPEHWEVKKAKWLFKKEERPVRKDDDIVTCFRDGQVTLRTNRKTEGFTNALKEHGYQGIRKGDFVIHNMDAFAGAIGVSDSDGKSTPVYSVCTPLNKKFTNCFYYSYFMREIARRGFIQSLTKGIRERSTDFRFNDFAVLFLPIPSMKEQNLIVNYIETITSKIATAISLKEQEIEKLKEYRATLINSAVTGKLRVPSVQEIKVNKNAK